ncbi:MAG TPA: hypothetical protein VGN18_11600 [Jatrophihabitans sp.]|jgi:hypothetical protein|uniref:hypothetical protein n=1 Tax=Jatrophihabitans sp. TaxID=1932789 RepID=UPI002E056787|nr:hypothetical protein [Jatrophihabitans sp.]
MRSPALVITGVIVALFGLLFTLQGVGIVKGSFMSDTTFWTIAGPVIAAAGLALAAAGARGRAR